MMQDAEIIVFRASLSPEAYQPIGYLQVTLYMSHRAHTHTHTTIQSAPFCKPFGDRRQMERRVVWRVYARITW